MPPLVTIKDAQEKTMLLEQYRILTESLNKTNDIRETSNNFWTGLNGAIVGVVAYVKDMQSIEGSPKQLFLWTLIIIGFFISAFWLRALAHIKKNIDTRNEMLIEMEKYLPAKIFTTALAILGRREGKSSLSLSEMKVPALFCLGYFIFALILLFYPSLVICRM